MADETETLPNRRKHQLSVQEMAYSGATVRYRVDVADYTLTGSGSTDTVTIELDSDTPVDWMVDKCFWNVVTAFAGTGSIAMELGTNGDPNAFIISQSVKTAGPFFDTAGAVPSVNDANTKAAAADVIQCVLTNSVSGGPDDWTAGQVDIYLGLRALNNVG